MGKVSYLHWRPERLFAPALAGRGKGGCSRMLSDKPWTLQAVRVGRTAFYISIEKKGYGAMGEKLRLYGFNNLTKALSFNNL